VVDALESGRGEVQIPDPVRRRALVPIERMLDFVAANPASIATGQRGHVPHLGSA
jgi:quinolinate synthase